MNPSSHAPASGEYDRLRQACGLLDDPGVARVDVDGEDGRRFINGMVTCDVASLASGDGSYGFFTDRMGHVLADVRVRMAEKNIWLELPTESADDIIDHLQKYIVADRVELKRREDLRASMLVGARAEELLAELAPGEELPRDRWGHGEIGLRGRQVALADERGWGLPAFTFWSAADEAISLVRELLALDTEIALGPVGRDALEVVRLEAGIPRFGQDFDRQNLPQETGLDEAVSYEKGCYLGQEVVARLHYRGQASRLMRGVVFDDDADLPAGRALLVDGREAGRLTSVGRSPQLERVIGLSILQRRATDPGTRVVVEGSELEGEVVELPFAGTATR